MTSTADRAELVSAVDARLREVAKLVRRSMLDAMPDGEPSQWLYAPMREYPSRPGKALRPALCLSAGRAFGADPNELLGMAVAIEMLHNAFLVHDDIADGSEMRRGRPTLAATHGVAAALNAGDALGDRGRPGVAAGHPAPRPRSCRSGVGRIRHDGNAHPRGAGDRGRLAARQSRGFAARGLPASDHAQDVLVHHHPSAARRRDRRFRRQRRAWSVGAVRLSLRRRVSDPRRSVESVGRRTDLRQGDSGRPLRGQADAAAGPLARGRARSATGNWFGTTCAAVDRSVRKSWCSECAR